MPNQEMDSDITGRFRQGDEDAFSQVFHSHYNGIYLFSLRLINSPADARDIVSDTFLKLWLLRQNFESLANIKAFLFLTARNACIDYLRSKQRQHALQKEIRYLSERADAEIDIAMIRADFFNELSRQIESLPPQCGQVFRMIFFQGKKTAEIAKELGISRKTVLAHKRNAILQLRSALLKKDFLFLAFLCRLSGII